MDINKNLPYFNSDIYSYDIKSCNYNVLLKLGLDITNIKEEIKKERNIKIGKLMISNPRLNYHIRGIVDSILNLYIRINNLTDKEIILRQFDGMLVTRRLKNDIALEISMDLREIFQIFIISINKDFYIGKTYDGEIKIKGVPNFYEGIKKYIIEILNLNFLSKEGIFTGLENIKDKLFRSEAVEDFIIPAKEENKYYIFITDIGEIQISDSLKKYISAEEIDKKFYFDKYIVPFSKAISFHFLNEKYRKV